MPEKIIAGCEPIIYSGNEIGCLLIHGFTSCPFEMRLLAKNLQKKEYTVRVPLISGHGVSPYILKKTKWYDWFESAKKELFLLRKQCKKIFVIGLSMGGTLALHLAAHYEVDGVAVLAPGLYLKNKFARLSDIIYPILKFSEKNSTPDIKANVKTISYNKIPVKSISELLKLFRHVKNDLPDIYAPALIIYSKFDHVVDSKSSIIIYKKISSREKRILELNQSYHILTLDVEKEKVFREIEIFIKQLS